MDTEQNAVLLGTSGSSPASRVDFLKIAAATGVGAALGSIALPHIARAATDDPATVLNVALVAEQLAVLFQTTALANAATIGLRPDEITTVQAIVATEAIHIRYLQAYGATPAYGTQNFTQFSFPTGTFSSRANYANVAIFLETAFVTAYMAATRDFAADARADLAQLTFQIGAVEAEHRALSRNVGGYAPYADLTFELNLIPTVLAGAGVLANGGFLSPVAGNTYTYTDQLAVNAINNYASLITKTTP